ncbi:hypothetical protein SCYAM73S_04826 [Streptomyces cyaneofuscatus]
MGSLLAALDEESMENQRDVVKNERRQRYDNVPYGTAFEKLTALAYPEGHPYHHTPIGSMADLDAATLEDARAFLRTYYAPNNAAALDRRADIAPSRPSPGQSPRLHTSETASLPVASTLPDQVEQQRCPTTTRPSCTPASPRRAPWRRPRPWSAPSRWTGWSRSSWATRPRSRSR